MEKRKRGMREREKSKQLHIQGWLRLKPGAGVLPRSPARVAEAQGPPSIARYNSRVMGGKQKSQDMGCGLARGDFIPPTVLEPKGSPTNTPHIPSLPLEL